MSLQGGNNPKRRSVMAEYANQLTMLANASRADLDTLPMDTLMRIRNDMVRLLPPVLQLCDTRIKQANSRAKYGARLFEGDEKK